MIQEEKMGGLKNNLGAVDGDIRDTYPAKTLRKPCDPGSRKDWTAMHIPAKKPVIVLDASTINNEHNDNHQEGHYKTKLPIELLSNIDMPVCF